MDMSLEVVSEGGDMDGEAWPLLLPFYYQLDMSSIFSSPVNMNLLLISSLLSWRDAKKTTVGFSIAAQDGVMALLSTLGVAKVEIPRYV